MEVYACEVLICKVVYYHLAVHCDKLKKHTTKFKTITKLTQQNYANKPTRRKADNEVIY